MAKRTQKPVVHFYGPQFHRAPTAPIPPAAPENLEGWDALRKLNMAELRAMGFGAWEDKPDAAGNVLMLIPEEWHKGLPPGLELESISGKHKTVGVDYIDDDIRYGCLAYGIRAPKG